MIRFTSNGMSWMADASGKILTIRTNLAPDIVASLDPEKKYVVEIAEKKDGRSSQQNRMYRALVGQIAKAIGISDTRCHNMILRDYGQPMIVDGEYVLVDVRDTDEAEAALLENDKLHMAPTSRVSISSSGDVFRTYYMLRGSSTYKTDEMSRLIDGAKEEARQLGLKLIWEE